MTTNQRIDGVPRELLEHALSALDTAASAFKSVKRVRNELRALLDAPIVNTDVRTILLDITPGMDGMGHEAYARSCEDVVAALSKQGDRIEEMEIELHRLKAAQSQGEPIHMVRSHGSDCWEKMNGESLELCKAQPGEYEVRKLYAEQPALVAECAHEWRALHQDWHVTITGCRKCQRFMEGQGTY